MRLRFAALLLLACAGPASTPRGDWPPAPPLEVPVDADAGALPPSVTATPAEDGRWLCAFQLASDVRADIAHLAGSFNGWSRDATPMTRGADGRWRVELELESGAHGYKFVLDGERWIADPENPDGESDNFGGRNSVLRLGRLADLDAGGALAGDGAIEGVALLHDPARPMYLQRLGDGRWLVRYRTLAGDVEGVSVALRDGGAAEMHLALAGERFDHWEASLAADGGEYAFVLRDGDLAASHPETFELDESTTPAFVTPEWAKHAIWYQVFVERFRNGDPANDPEPVRPWTSDWHEPSPWEERGGQTLWRYSIFRRHYGGDLAGLSEGLDHLESLGVNALYLNPVFQARSNHKYDATSFVHVDDAFGAGEGYAAAEAEEDLKDPETWTWTASDRLFLEFLEEAHERGLRVIVDGVFNHVGVAHPAFLDVRENGRSSPFAGWFDVRSWEPFEYAGWAGFGELPVFAKSARGLASEEVKRHVFAVTRRWMDPDGDGDPSDGIDGWRLDVPMEIAGPFWVEWRALVKSINPDAYLTGEVWDRADQWLDGSRFDAVMNYPFAEAAIAWIGDVERKITASELDRRLAELRLAYPAEATYVLMNLADSHDTDRLVSMFANPDRRYDAENRPQDDAPYDESKPDELEYRRARLFALLQATYVGAPMVYYGDEMGMWGADDPSNRKPMLWSDLEPYAEPRENRVMEEHLAHYRAALNLRREHSALRVGSYETLLVDDEADVFAFLREADTERVVVALNAGERAKSVPLPILEEGEWRTVFGLDHADPPRLWKLPAIRGRVWVQER